MKKAIVTGANGFIGKSLINALSQKGWNVIAVLHHASNNNDFKHLSNVKIVYCDLSDYSELPKRIEEREFDVFYHLAWSGCSGSLRGDSQVQLSNIRFTCDAVEACAELTCKRFVFASSIMEFEVMKLMGTEKPPSISTLYSSAKLASHYMAKALAVENSIIFNAAIISNIYGVGETSQRIISSSIHKMLRGEHISFSPGEQLYDFIYITDAVNAFIAIGENGHSQKDYYIGNAVPRQLKEYLFEMRDIVAPDLKIGVGDIPFDGISLTYNEVNTSALKEDFGFIPTVSFKKGIARIEKWLTEKEGSTLLDE